MTDASMLTKGAYERRENDAYYTEPRVTEALLGALELRGRVWEPAAGRGDMADVIEKAGYHVVATDIDRDWDFFDFIRPHHGYETIITNPPYSVAVRFVRHALDLMEPVGGMVVMLFRNEWDSAASRRDLFTEKPFRTKYVLTFRPRWDWWETDKPKTGPRHNFSWFVWDWRHTGPATIAWLA